MAWERPCRLPGWPAAMAVRPQEDHLASLCHIRSHSCFGPGNLETRELVLSLSCLPVLTDSHCVDQACLNLPESHPG